MRVLLISSGALFLVSTGAFFLYVPPLSIATAVLILVGLTLMFGLGFQAGGQGMVPCEAIEDQAWYLAGIARKSKVRVNLTNARTIGMSKDQTAKR
jgi:hypothetical protein